MQNVRQYGIFEVSFKGALSGEPFTDSSVEGIFESGNEVKKVEGFYDGYDTYIVRFMPSFCGEYKYRITANCINEEICGEFIVTEAAENVHGMVRVDNKYHFSYSDKTPYYPVGTTCYAWLHQSADMREKTIETLKRSPFNKIRMCIFPKDYIFNKTDPDLFPFERIQTDEGYEWDYTRFCPEYFRNIEHCVGRLDELGIEADLILFHPYDRWGFSEMPADVNQRYLEYVLARLGAYKNVWWSLANEYDFLKKKTEADWDSYGEYLSENDCYHHLISIHNCGELYHPDRSWITHLSIQLQDIYKLSLSGDDHREHFGKPVIFDEVGYEGNLNYAWGSLTAETLLYRFYEAVFGGAYATHGETFYSDEERIWWSHGGELHGEVVPRLAFLKKILEQIPGNGLKRIKMDWDETAVCAEDDENYMLFYFSFYRPCSRKFALLDAESDYHVELIDTWDMTVTDMGILCGRFELEMPSKQWQLVRVRKEG